MVRLSGTTMSVALLSAINQFSWLALQNWLRTDHDLWFWLWQQVRLERKSFAVLKSRLGLQDTSWCCLSFNPSRDGVGHFGLVF